MRLTVIETHPVQYHAPVYRCLQQKLGLTVTVIYGSDHSLKGYYDKDFGKSITWDTDLLSGYTSIFLSRQEETKTALSRDRVADAIDKSFPDAVLISGYSQQIYRKAFFHCLKAGYPVLFRAETLDIGRPLSFIRGKFRDMLLKEWYQRCASLLYIGKASKQHYERLGITGPKLRFSPYCVDNTTFQTNEQARSVLRQQVREKLNIPEDAKVILFSGKFIPRKNPGIILDAMKYLSRDIKKSIEIIFMGDGPLDGELKSRAKQLPEIKTHFVGFQNQTQLSPYYHASDVMVLPSLYEPWGLVVNEALEHGVPCVVSDVIGCAGDLITPGQTGEIFTDHSPQSLAESLQRALSLGGCTNIRKQCREKVERYSISHAAEGIVQAFKEHGLTTNHKREITQNGRILLLGSDAGTSLEKMYIRAFRELGYLHVDLFNTDLKTFTGLGRLLNPVFRHTQNHLVGRYLVRFLKSRKPYDAVFVFKGMFLTPDLLRRLGKISKQTLWVNINPDDPFNVQSKGASNQNVLQSISFYDVYGIWSKVVLNKLKQNGCKKAVYLPFGYDSEYHTLSNSTKRDKSSTLLFIGSWDKERERVLEGLVDYDLKIYGLNWDRLPLFSPLHAKIAGEVIFGKKLCEEVRNAAINLNLLRQQNYGSHNMRTFEIPAMGGFMLATRTEEQQSFFEEGTEADYFSSFEELVKKIKYYLEHNDHRERVARAGYEKCQRLKASYKDRLHGLLEELNG